MHDALPTRPGPQDVLIEVEARQITDPHRHHEQELYTEGALDLESITSRMCRTCAVACEDTRRKVYEGANIARIIELTEAVAILIGEAGFTWL
jgi:hypothetical protein